MPKIVDLRPVVKSEEQIPLSDIGFGNIFRHPICTYEQAKFGKDEHCFYEVINIVPAKTNKVWVKSADGKQIESLDGDRLVVPHPSALAVGEAKRV